jgi:cytochrome c556
MKKSFMTFCIAFALPTMSIAADDPVKDIIEARQSVMNLYAYSMGTLGGMAKGKIEYNAEVAAAAAKNLQLVDQLDQASMWPEGSHNGVDAYKDLTKAKPEGWSEYPKLAKISEDLSAAAEKLAANAGNGLDALRANIGAVGKTCKGCHDIAKAK